MRLFVAIEVPETVRRELERRASRVRRELPGARWARPETLHLTLVFLGETDPSLVPRLSAALGPAFAAFEPFEVQLREGGSFPPGRPARVAWVGVTPEEGLKRLEASVSRVAVEVAGIEPDHRHYHPHLTLARCAPPWKRRALDTFVRAFHGPVGEPFTVERGVLFRSELAAGGARHFPLATYPLSPESEAP